MSTWGVQTKPGALDEKREKRETSIRGKKDKEREKKKREHDKRKDRKTEREIN